MRRDTRDLGLIFKTHENTPAATPEADVTAIYADFQTLADATADAMGNLLRGERLDRQQDVAELRREISELRGKVDLLVTLLGKSGADVVPLSPRKHA